MYKLARKAFFDNFDDENMTNIIYFIVERHLSIHDRIHNYDMTSENIVRNKNIHKNISLPQHTRSSINRFFFF